MFALSKTIMDVETMIHMYADPGNDHLPNKGIATSGENHFRCTAVLRRRTTADVSTEQFLSIDDRNSTSSISAYRKLIQ